MNQVLGNIDIYSLQSKSVSELKELVIQYPYFSILKTVLAQKTSINKLDKISIAATYSPDRSYLYTEGPSVSSSFITIEETILGVLPVIDNDLELLKKKKKNRARNKREETPYEKIETSKFSKWVSSLIAPSVANEGSIVEDEVIKIADIIEEEKEPTQVEIPKKKKKKKKVIAFAIDSIKSDKTIVSQTLAIILENQKAYLDAIDMYKRLILKYPEKSAYFVKKIKKLNKKI